MAAGGVCGAGGVKPVQTSTSSIGQLCQLWSCWDREDNWGAWPGSGLGLWGSRVGLFGVFALGAVWEGYLSLTGGLGLELLQVGDGSQEDSPHLRHE